MPFLKLHSTSSQSRYPHHYINTKKRPAFPQKTFPYLTLLQQYLGQQSCNTMASTATKSYIAGPRLTHSHTVILLHGRDCDAEEFASEFFQSQGLKNRNLPEIFPTIRWVFPGSMMRHSSRFQKAMCQWFDTWSVEEPQERREIQGDGLQESVSYIYEVVRQESSLISPEKIILGGISQGSAAAIHALLGCDTSLGGFIGLCTWLPFQEEVKAGTAPTQKSAIPTPYRPFTGLTRSARTTPVFLAHSKDDDVVGIGHGVAMHEALEKLGMGVRWKEYGRGGHWITQPQGVNDMACFIRDCFPDCSTSTYLED